MASRYGLPHQFIAGNQPSSRYRSHSQPRTPKEFDREAHSDQLLSELNKGVEKFKEERPEDDRLGTSDGVYLEVVLRSGSSAVDVLQKNKMEMGATKVLPNGDKVVGLYVPHKSLPILHSLKMSRQQMSKPNFIRVYFPFIQRHYYSFCFISATKKEFSKLASDSFRTQYVNLLFRFI